MVHQHPSGPIHSLSDSQSYWEERCGQSSTLEVARIPSPARSDPDLDFSHDCHGQEFCLYGPAVPTASSHNDYPTPVVLSDRPHSLPQSSEPQREIPISSYFPNNDDESFPVGYPGVPVTPHYPVIGFESFSPTGTYVALGLAQRSNFHRDERVLHNTNAVTHEPISQAIADPVSNLGEGRCPHNGRQWVCSPPNMARPLKMDRYSSSSHMALSPYYDSQNIRSDVLYMSHNAQSQLCSDPSYPPMSPPSPETHHFASTSSYQGQGLAEAASMDVEPSPATRVSIEVSPVMPVFSQSESNIAAVAETKNRCPLCGTCFTQPQVLNRHMKDKHEDKGSCGYCSSFKWSRGRPHLYRKHLRVKHSGLTFSDSPLAGGTLRAHILRVLQSRAPHKKSQVASREPPIPYAGNLWAHK
ncbi:hypothetical protein H4582DRAFT_948889 [Lactarius indigo]|nr:hypothetical protein H4582DRAFT_948889 [Lactarius indigo]